MAIYHLSVSTISRTSGRSSVAAAAYRCGVRLEDQRTGRVHDYTRKRGVAGWRVFAPRWAPAWTAVSADLKVG